MAAPSTTPAARRRRTPEEAEREILDAAEQLLRDRPLGQVSVARIMDATTLSRNAFYVYFRDRYDLFGRLADRVRGEADATVAAYADRAAPAAAAGREAIAAAARLYAEHGELLQALSQGAAHDGSAARAWAAFARPAEAAASARVREELRAGKITGIDPEPTVRALIAMNRACFFDELVGKPDADADALVDVLHAIWVRTLYGAPARTP